jgi:hypothetical protein
MLRSDQWKDQGHCPSCRRNNYCHAPCAASKKAMRRISEEAYREVMRKKGIDIDLVLPEGIKYE